MEADPGKQRPQQKRRVREQQDKQTVEEGDTSCLDDHGVSPARSSKDKLPQLKPGKGKSALFEEDIIDGFAIISFTTLEELEIVAKKNGCINTITPLDSDTDIRDTNYEDKNGINKTRKKKLKKNPSLTRVVIDCEDSSGGNISHPNGSIYTNNNINHCLGAITSCAVDGAIIDHHIATSGSDCPGLDSIGGSNHVVQNISVDDQTQHNNGSDEPAPCVFNGRLNVCGVENGNDEVSEAGPDFVSGTQGQGVLNHETSIDPTHRATSSPSAPAVTNTSTTLCNGICDSVRHTPSPLHHLLVATTTGTTTTTTTSKPSFTNSLTTSTPVAITAAALPSPSVIQSSPHLPNDQCLKPAQLSPVSSLSHNSNKRTLSPDSQQPSSNLHQSKGCFFENSSCARSEQYSKIHKENKSRHKEDNHNHLPKNFSGGTSLHHHHYAQQRTADKHCPSGIQHGSGNITHRSSDVAAVRTNHQHPLGFAHSASHPACPVPLRPDSDPNHESSLRPVSRSSGDQANKGGNSGISNNGVHTSSDSSSLPVTSTPFGLSHKENHHHSNKHRRPPPSGKLQPDQQHQNSHSPFKQHSKLLPSRTPPGVLPLPTSTSLLFDAAKYFSPAPEKLILPPGGYRKDPGEALKSTEDLSPASGVLQRQYSREPHRDREEREKERDKSAALLPLSTIFPSPKPSWTSSPRSLCGPLVQPSPITQSPALHPLTPHIPPTSHSSPLYPLPLAAPPPLLAAGSNSLQSGMFVPPLHPTPPTLSSAAGLPTHPAVAGQYTTESLLRGQDYLHQDLNNRLLAHHDSSSIALPSSPFVRSETHQHQHQHLHNHMHQHTYGGLTAAPLVPPAPPPLFDKIPKAFDSGVFRPSIVPNYSAAFASLLPAGPSGAGLASGLHGAFQPKNLAAPAQMLASFRDREKAFPPAGLPPSQKKQGKWCAVHVRLAWEIYHRQQKKLEREPEGSSSSKLSPDSKPLEPLFRPATHLLSGGGIPARPHESSLLSSVARGGPECIGMTSPSFLTTAPQLGLSVFPRPSPYPPPSLLNPLGFSGLGSTMFGPVHDMAPPSLPGPLTSTHQELSRLQRSQSSFTSWPKLDAEREKERDRDLRKEEERDHRGHHLHGLDDPRHVESTRPKSRSRSRSPLLNGRLDLHNKPDLGLYDKRPLSATSSALKLKDDRREDDMPSLSHHLAEREKRERERVERDRMERERLERERLEKEKLLQSAEREKLLQAVEQREKFLQATGYLGLSSLGLPAHPGLLDRRVSFMGHPGSAYPFLDRPSAPSSMWSPFDKSAELAHRLDAERERDRMAMMSRLSGIPSHLAALEQERLKEQIIREQQEREYEIRRQYLDRLPAFTADRLRAVDPLAFGSYFPQTFNPMFGHGPLGLKSNSPHGLPGAPPPLIPSSSSMSGTMLSRNHDNSPSSSSKSKGCSPADSTSDLKDKREGSSVDPDAHLR